jgi:uncharacterized protein (AIM24 family)
MPPPLGSERQSLAPPPADSTREVAQEDFLFHLYRGSELLQENRVLEAKEELEYALTMQPLDAKGQDLLGAVYFRLGLYPRAIQIYEGLERQFSRDTSIKINLALAYLKTGQAEPARRLLKETVTLQPEHKRAWGYLGLAQQKLGELEQAQAAFERGGHALMARRMTEKRRQSLAPPPVEPASSAAPAVVGEGVRAMAEVAFSELDAGELRFALAQPQQPKPGETDWHPHEIGEPGVTHGSAVKTLPPPAITELKNVHETVTVPPPPSAFVPEASAAVRRAEQAIETRELPPPSEETSAVSARALQALRTGATSGGVDGPGRPLALALRPGQRLGLVDPGALVVRLTPEPDAGYAARLEAVRALSGAATSRVLHRRTRDAELAEVLGGIGSPMMRMSGQGQLVLGPRPGHHISLLALRDGVAFVLEDRLLGFELGLAYENGRIALEYAGERTRGQSDAAAVVQLRGTGSFAVEVAGVLATVATPSALAVQAAGSPLVVRREWIVGWFGRLVAHALEPAEALGGQRGLIGFSGEGEVLVCAG